VGNNDTHARDRPCPAADGGTQWQALRDSLCHRYQVVTPDLPGFGDNAAATAPSFIADYAEYVLDSVSAQGIEQFDLLGHSMGGMIVQELVALAPARVRRLVLYGTGAFSNVAGRFETYDESKCNAEADGPRATARRVAATWFRHCEQAPGYEACAAVAEQASLQAIHAGIDAFGNWSRENNLPNITSPTLIIWGKHDKSYGWSQIKQLWYTIPSASLAVVPGCAHAFHLEKPELFNLLLRAFLDGQRQHLE
jgi:2-hydroxy-6-oxonona-2,4-dienedioate hydrolase